MIKDLRNFSGGIDFDSDPRNVAPNDYTYGMCLASGMADNGAVTNMLGSRKVDYTLPNGVNTCIGTLRNIKENSIIYFVHNDLGNHSILEYYCLTKNIEPIFEPRPALNFTTNFLGFTIENKIHSANLLDDILTWTDNNVSPRKINKKSAKAFLNQTPASADVFPYSNLIATGTDAQKLQFIELIKWKPTFIGNVELGYDPSRNTNFLTELMVQMKYRYIYDDNEISRWSDGTTISLPTGNENINGTITLKTNNNFLKCFVDTGHPTVKKIDVAFRFGDRGVWARLDEPIKKYNENNQRVLNDYTSHEVIFYNDSVLVQVVDEIDNYDAVPLRCKAQDIIDGNMLALANVEEGYENPTLDANVTLRRSTFSFGSTTLFAGDKTPSLTLFTIAPMNNAVSGGVFQNPNTEPYRQIICIPYNPVNVVVGTTIVFKLRTSSVSNFATSVDYNFNFTILENDLVNYPNNLTARLVESIDNVAGLSFIASFDGVTSGAVTTNSRPQYNGISMKYILMQNWTAPSQYVTMEDFNVITPLKKTTSLKKGSQPIFGIVYRDDEGRDGGVLTGETMMPYVPFMPETEFKGAPVLANNAYRYRPEINIRHLPPIWATNYQIVYAGNNLKKYTQFILKGVSNILGPLTSAGPDVVLLPNGNYILDCTYIVDYISKDRIQTSVDFQFEKGDRLRFIQNAQNWVSEYIECKVLDFDEATNKLTVTPFDISLVTNTMTIQTLQGCVVELFAYNENISKENRPYFAIGNVMPIKNPGTPSRAHEGNVRTQSGNIGAIQRLEFGDTYIFRRYFFSNTIATIAESENFSDFYPSKNIGISSVYAVIPNGKTKRYEQLIRHGGRYFQNTNTNNLSRFDSDDFDILNAMYGPINKIVTMGYTLKCLQTKKNTSIYISRNMVFNANGASQLTLTDKVFGDKNPSELDYGCEHPESVCVDERQIYFFDVNTGTIIQDSANGMKPISDYKAKTYWRGIADKIKNKEGIFVYSCVDNFNRYVHFTIQDTNNLPVVGSQTLVYHEDENRWKSFQPYIPEYYGANAIVMVAFKNGELWEHNSELVPRNNFFGEQYNTEVETVSNIQYPSVKVFNSVSVYANKVFYSPNIGDIKTIANGNYLQGMISRLLKSKFRPKEGVFYADYLRDANTPNMPSPEGALMEGRKLRGEFMLQKLINDDTDKVVLYSVLITSVKSDKSG